MTTETVPIRPPTRAVIAPAASTGTGRDPAVVRTGSRPYAPLLDVVRIVAVTGVVVVHVIAEHVGPDSPLVMLVLRSLLAAAVPAFVMISGALNLAPEAMRHGSRRFLGRRLARLLPATAAWTAFYVLVVQGLFDPERFEPRGAVADLLAASSYPHLYFLPLIIGLTVITPMLAAYLADLPRRSWLVGGAAALWAMALMAVPALSEGLLGREVGTLQLGTLTYFLPFIGYYVLGRAAWIAPPPRRGALLLLTVATPVLMACTVWAYASPSTQQGAGGFLLPTYLAPTVMLLSLSLITAVMALGRRWTVGPHTQQRLRRLGDAAFGVFLVHFAILVPLRAAGFPEDSVPSVLMLAVTVTLLSFAVSLLGARVPGLRRIL